MAINSFDYPFNYPLNGKLIVPHNQLVYALAQVAKALEIIDVAQQNKLTAVEISPQAKAMADRLKQDGKSIIILGSMALQHPEAAQLRALAKIISEKTGAALAFLTDGCNSAGAYLAGALPHRGPAGQVTQPGLSAQQLLTTRPVRAYFILGAELEHDCAFGAATMRALKEAGLVVCLTSFVTPAMFAYADFILPITPYSENSGTYVNVEGVWQSFAPTSVPHGESKPAWKVLRVLANLFEVEGFNFESAEEVRTELKQLVDQMQPQSYVASGLTTIQKPAKKIWRNGAWPMAYVDGLTRRAEALVTAFPEQAAVRLNSTMATEFGLQAKNLAKVSQGDAELYLPVIIDERVANDTVVLHSGLPETAAFGRAFGEIAINK